jgi:uncharacterized protein (TIGR03435 family)
MGVRVTVQQVAKSLSLRGVFDRPVVDHTGLQGEFDFVALPTPDMVAATPQATLLIAIREQLGIMIRPEQGAYDVLRVRRIEKPSPN